MPNLISEVRTANAAVLFVPVWLPWRFIGWLYADSFGSFFLPLLYILNGQSNIQTRYIKLKLVRPNIINVANTLSDSWMWLNLWVNQAVTGDFSANSAWVTETRRDEQSALASVCSNCVTQQGHKCSPTVPWQWSGPLEHRESSPCRHQHWKWCSHINNNHDNN